MLNIRSLLLAGIDSFGRLSSEKWNLLVRAVRELQEIGDYGMTVEKFQKLLQKYASPMFLSKQKDDFTRFLIYFYSGLIADKFIKSNDFKHGQWGKDDNGRDRNDGVGFSIFKDDVNTWTIELDYAIIRQLLRAKELYTEKAHIGQVSNQTVFLVGLQTLGNILLGEYAEGVQGGILTPDGDAELRKLVTRGLAKLAELYVVGDSTFGGSLSSVEFISSFLGGKGWAIQKKTRINSAGVEEEYYTLEIDNVTVRETLRVYEMIVSQLRGEFDNYVFAAMMEVHHYDPETGKVWLSTECGRIKAVAFHPGDYIKVQQYQAGNDVVSGGDGYITKGYELIITDSGTGGMTDDNGDRLDWVTFKNFTTSVENGTPESVIQKKDTFVRIDNETNQERKGLMQIITVGPNTPYMDVYYGMKTDPNDALKLREGNLQGVRTDIFGWLEGYGAYLPNLYAVGKMFNRQTGESLNSSIEITRERLKSVYTETTFNISDEDNFLSNGFFARDLEDWTPCSCDGGAAPEAVTTEAIDSGNGTPLMVNGAVLAYQARLTAKMTEYSGIKVLHLLGMGVYQSFADIKANSTHKENVTDNDQSENYTQTQDVYDTLYMGVRILPLSAGTLSVTFMKSDDSTIASWSQVLNASHEWQLVQSLDTKQDPWQYTGEQGRMILAYTGECYIRFVALRTDPIVNSRETYETMIEQTARRITLTAKKLSDDLTEAVSEINIEFDNIRTTVTNNKDAADAAFESLREDLEQEVSDREDLEEYYYGTWAYQNDYLLSLMAAQFNEDGTIIGYADLKVQVDGISTTVTDNKTAADNAFKDLKDDLDAETTAREELETEYHATWVYQNDTLLSLMAGEFNADGTIKGYADLQLAVDGLSTTVTNNKKAADDAIDALNEWLKEVDDEQTETASWISQRANGIAAAAASFDANGNIKADGKIALYVANELSYFSVDADNINFTTFDWSVKNPSNQEVFHLDSNGNLSIAGKFHGEFDDTVEFGTGTKKMYIEPTSTGARLIGKDGTYETLYLGFYQYNGNSVPAMYLKSKASNNQDSLVRIMSGSDFAEVLAESAGSTGAYHIVRMIAYPREGYGTIEGNHWPKKSDTEIYNKLSKGAVYVDGDVLKVKGYS